TKTGHHTPLYSTQEQVESTDNAVQKLLKMGVPADKIIVGAAFYGRMWENVPDINTGLYQSGKFKMGIDYKDFSKQLASDSGFVYHWDEKAKAPYLYNPTKKLFVTYGDPRSIGLKTRYVIERGLGGIMFWELGGDLYANGLLEAIDKARSQNSGN
ncbi:MAG: glycoside hydrolase family 18 protein, partial [Flavisolibacter sp.]